MHVKQNPLGVVILSSKLPDKKSSDQQIQAFLKQVNNTPALRTEGRGRLIFAIDATASREHVWDMASHQHAAMFNETEKVGGLSVQLCYYRGYGECKSSKWSTSADALKRQILSVRCLAGKTQIARVLRHAINENQSAPVNALVFVGDCVEENPDHLGALAGELGIHNVPMFVFQEGYDEAASRTFRHLAALTRGAHCHFDAGSAKKLGELLAAVAVYASGGANALKINLLSQSKDVQLLLSQLKG